MIAHWRCCVSLWCYSCYMEETDDGSGRGGVAHAGVAARLWMAAAKDDAECWQHRHKDEHRQRNCGLHVRAKIMGRKAAAAIALCAQQ